jgi:enamine deaminase RidA (YjgF/YER057c/UK114 family)
MKQKLLFIVCCIWFCGCADSGSSPNDPELKLKQLGIELKAPPEPTASFVGAVSSGKLVFLSGAGPRKADNTFVQGKVGETVTLEEAQSAAKLAGVALLESLKAEVGDLRKVKRIVKVLGMVNAKPDFTQQSQVINGFSDFIVEVFGDKGKHARSSVGVGSLPSNIPVEIEMIVEVE